jgi:hypothetical protein
MQSENIKEYKYVITNKIYYNHMKNKYIMLKDWMKNNNINLYVYSGEVLEKIKKLLITIKDLNF